MRGLQSLLGKGAVFRFFCAELRCEPDERDGGNDAEREVRVRTREQDGGEVRRHAKPTFLQLSAMLQDLLLAGLRAGVAEIAPDGHAEELKSDAGEQHAGGVQHDGEAIEVLFNEVIGEERE